MTGLKFATAAAACFLLPACGPIQTIDRTQATTFERGADGKSFRYVGFADAAYPLESQSGEAYRLKLLSQWLSENAMCAGGFEIASRNPTVVQRGALGIIAKVAYDGRCK